MDTRNEHASQSPMQSCNELSFFAVSLNLFNIATHIQPMREMTSSSYQRKNGLHDVYAIMLELFSMFD